MHEDLKYKGYAVLPPSSGTKRWYEGVMQMALPTGMVRHPKTGMLWVRRDIPVALRPYFGGKTSLKKTLGTKDQKQAEGLFHFLMNEIAQRFEYARKLAAGDATAAAPVIQIYLTPEQQAQARALRMMTPQGQMEDALGKMNAKLEAAKLINPVAEALTLGELFTKWKTERKPAQSSILEYERSKDLFLKLNQVRPLADYTVQHARAWKDHVLAITREGKPLSFGTQIKIFGAVKTLFRYADRNEFLSADPFQRITLERPKRTKVAKRDDWEPDDLRMWFGSHIYKSDERPRGGGGEATYWLPILALFHGFRAGELCQLDRHDVITRNDVVCLRLAPSDEDDLHQGKSIKTEQSIRVVPVHRRVIALGFLEYVKSVKGRKLFPQIKPDSKGRWSGLFSKWFGRYRRSVGLKEGTKPFHAFRHTWKTAARSAGISEEIHDEISGHEKANEGRSYGSIPIKVLKAAVDSVDFDYVRIPTWTVRK